MNYKINTLLSWATILASIGSINWGLISLSGANIVEIIFGRWPWVVSTVYILVGLSGIYLLLPTKKKFKY